VDRAEISASDGVRVELAGHGIEWVIAGQGADTLIGGAADETLDGGPGKDDLTGGAGNDLYKIDASGDTILEATGGGTDAVDSSANYALSANVEHLTLAGGGNTTATGNDLNNRLIGNDGKNTLNGGDGGDSLSGGAGNDTLKGENGDDSLMGGDGRDNLNGGDGNDMLAGGEGSDTLTGGDGADKFVFNGPDDSLIGNQRDVIKDFNPAVDRIDLTGIGDFTYIESESFAGPYQVRFSSGKLQLNVGVDGDGGDDPEMEIALSNVKRGDLGADADPDWLIQ
jgi:Ca2+-binding RTX toxin-like protein